MDVSLCIELCRSTWPIPASSSGSAGERSTFGRQDEDVFRFRGVPSHQINRGAVRSATQRAVDFLSDTARIMERLIAHVPDQDFRQQLTEFRDQVRQLLTAFN